MSKKPQLLYLFSSNSRPLYEQDILDVLAAPAGSLYQFRYDQRWVEASTRGNWLTLAPNTPVLVHFSLQQPAKYHEPVFFPIRLGQVVKTDREGDALFVSFRLGDFISLPAPEQAEGSSPDFAGQTKRYASYLAQHQIPRPYAVSAALGPDVTADIEAPLAVGGDQVELFERTTRYLQSTTSFRDARFMRFLRITRRGEDTAVTPNRDGVIELVGGSTYLLELFHHQTAPVVSSERFALSADDGIIRVIGPLEFAIGSRYDRIAIPIHAVQSDKNEARETMFLVQPAGSVRGPQLRLAFRVQPPTGKLVAAAVASTVALFVLGSAALLPFGTGVKVSLIVGAVVLIAVLNFFGLFVGALSGFQFPSLSGTQGGKSTTT